MSFQPLITEKKKKEKFVNGWKSRVLRVLIRSS